MSNIITIWRSNASGTTDRFGNAAPSTPEYAYVRYEENTRMFITKNADELRGKGYVFCTTDVIRENDIVALGKFVDTVPTTDAVVIKDRRVVPTFRGDRTEYRYGF